MGNNERRDDSTMLLLLQTISDQNKSLFDKFDELNKVVTESKIKCIECENIAENNIKEISDKVQPLIEKFNKDTEEVPVSKKLWRYFLNPTLIGSVLLSIIIFAITYTNALNQGKTAIRLNALETNAVTVDQLTNILATLKNKINGN